MTNLSEQGKSELGQTCGDEFDKNIMYEILMHWLFEILLCLDGHLPRPGWSGEGLGVPTGQGTLSQDWRGKEQGEWGSVREMGGGEEVEILNGIIYKAIKNK